MALTVPAVALTKQLAEAMKRDTESRKQLDAVQSQMETLRTAGSKQAPCLLAGRPRRWGARVHAPRAHTPLLESWTRNFCKS